jgi:hypothetical protein
MKMKMKPMRRKISHIPSSVHPHEGFRFFVIFALVASFFSSTQQMCNAKHEFFNGFNGGELNYRVTCDFLPRPVTGRRGVMTKKMPQRGR